MPGMRPTAVSSLIILLATLQGGCAASDDPATSDGLGTMSYALTGTFPGAKRMKVRVYQGAVTNLSAGLKYELPCISYLGADGSTAKNAFTLDRLPTRNDYAIVIDLFADDACTDLKVRAYRSGLVVSDSVESEVAKHPYYIQPFIIDAFSGMARPNAALQAEAKGRACSTDTDCKSVHAAATCGADKNCEMDSLFPLNGGARRAFPSVVTLSTGEVAISGGLSVADKAGNWSATNELVEIFDPSLGLFRSPASRVDNFGGQARVGLATALSLPGRTFGLIGGTAKANIHSVTGGISTLLQAESCGGSGASCPASKAVWRVDLDANISAGTQLDTFLAMPIVERVATADGPRILIAGGAALPLPKSGDSRSKEAFLCELGAGVAACISSSAFMNAARANAPTACLKSTPDGCKRLLILAGRASDKAALAEIYDAETDKFIEVAVSGPGTVGAVHGGHMVKVAPNKLLLLGVTGPAPMLDPAAPKLGGDTLPVMLEIDDSGDAPKINATVVELGAFAGKDSGRRALAAAIGLPDGSALHIGGLGPDGKAIADAMRISAEGKVIGRVPLEVARFGASAARIGGLGPLAGCVLVAGGITDSQPTGLQAVNHVEVFCPAGQ